MECPPSRPLEVPEIKVIGEDEDSGNEFEHFNYKKLEEC